MKKYYYKGITYTKVGSFNSKYQIVVNGLLLTFFSRDALKRYIDMKCKEI